MRVESFWPRGEPASLPCGCILIQTGCMYFLHTNTATHSTLRSPYFQTTYCRSRSELISYTEPLPPFLLSLSWELSRIIYLGKCQRGTPPPIFKGSPLETNVMKNLEVCLSGCKYFALQCRWKHRRFIAPEKETTVLKIASQTSNRCIFLMLLEDF